MTIVLAVAMLLAGAGLAGWWLERDRRIAAERLAGVHWAATAPPPVPGPAESLEQRALRMEGERTKVGVIERIMQSGVSRAEAERLWKVANYEDIQS